MSPERTVVDIFARITFGATGAPTLVASQSKGILSVTRNSAGKYTIVFGRAAGSLDTFPKLLMIKHLFDASGNSGASPAAPNMVLLNDSSATAGTASIQIEFTGPTAGGNTAQIATDPASGEAVDLEFSFRNSTAY